MDALANPFAPGAGVPPPALTGRQHEIAAFDALIARLGAGRPQNSLILYGLRGVGKTVLLGEFRRRARAAGWQSLAIEARAGMDFEQSFARELYLAMRRLEGRGDQARSVLQRIYRALASFEVRYGDQGWTLGVNAEPQAALADSGDLEADITDLLITAAEAAQHEDSGLVIFIDEMQLLPRAALEAIVAAFHEAAQRVLPLALAGVGLPQLPGIVATAKTYAERLFAYHRMEPLTDAAARDALRIPAEKEGVAFAVEVLDAVVERSERYPYFLQLYGKRLWDAAAGSPIGLDDLAAVEPAVVGELDDGFFEVRWQKATAAERRYISAVAIGGDGPQHTRVVAERLERTQRETSVQRDGLIKKGLIYSPDHGYVAFTAPRFADYVRRRHPLEVA